MRRQGGGGERAEGVHVDLDQGRAGSRESRFEGGADLLHGLAAPMGQAGDAGEIAEVGNQ